MAIVIGIDVGISTTKIVGINDEGQVVAPKRIKATDPVASLYGAFGKYLYDNKISPKSLMSRSLRSSRRAPPFSRQALPARIRFRASAQALFPMCWTPRSMTR